MKVGHTFLKLPHFNEVTNHVYILDLLLRLSQVCSGSNFINTPQCFQLLQYLVSQDAIIFVVVKLIFCHCGVSSCLHELVKQTKVSYVNQSLHMIICEGRKIPFVKSLHLKWLRLLLQR